MSNKKYACVLQWLPPTTLPAAEQEKVKSLYDQVVFTVDGLKSEQSTYRLGIQAKLESSLSSGLKSADEAIRTFETEYENGTRNEWSPLQERLKQLTESGSAPVPVAQAAQNAWNKANAKVISYCVVIIPGKSPEIYLAKMEKSPRTSSKELGKFKVGQVYLGDDRFVKVDPQPDGLQHTVYKHRTNGIEYVQDKHQRFVRRYQLRCLNTQDRDDIASQDATHIGPRAISGLVSEDELKNYGYKGYKAGQTVTEADRIFFHLQKGENRLTSMSSTKHKLYSNSGDAFYDATKGVVSIDLAMVDKNRIIDVHTKEAAKQLILDPSEIKGLTKESMYAQALSGELSNKKEIQDMQRAIRDVVRTRELLVDGLIPKKAIHKYDRSFKYPHPAHL